MPRKKSKPVEQKKPLKLKSRFMGLVKENEAKLKDLQFDIVVIEGEEYVEFKKLKGIFFAKKMFV